MAGDPVRAAQLAMSQVGKPYKWGTPINTTTADPKSFDCSGLVAWAYWHAGAKGLGLIHNSAALYAAMRHIPATEANIGDLVFYGAPPHHVAMVLGNGELVEAYQSGEPVRTRAYTAGEADMLKSAGQFPSPRSKLPSQCPGDYMCPPGAYHAPLPASDRADIISYCQSVHVAWHKLIGISDTKLLAIYQQAWNGQGDHKKSIGGLEPPGTGPGSPGDVSGLPGDVYKAGKATISAAEAIPTLISKLLDPNTWLRVLEVLLGVAVLGIGLAKMTGTSNMVSKAVKARVP